MGQGPRKWTQINQGQLEGSFCQNSVPSLSMYSPVPCYLWLTDSLIDCLTDFCDMTWKQLLWRPWVPWTLGSDVPLVMFSINGQIMNFCVWADWICHFISAFLILCCVILLFLYYLVPATRSISIFGLGKKVRDGLGTAIPSGPGHRKGFKVTQPWGGGVQEQPPNSSFNGQKMTFFIQNNHLCLQYFLQIVILDCKVFSISSNSNEEKTLVNLSTG